MTKVTPQQIRHEIDDFMAHPPAPGWTKFHVIPNSHPFSSRREPHGQYTIMRRPSDYLVKYAAEIGDVGAIAPIERIGTYPTIEGALDAVDQHRDSVGAPSLDEPSPEQYLALQEVANLGGRTWKSQLMRDWHTNRIRSYANSALLISVRDRFGDDWLRSRCHLKPR